MLESPKMRSKLPYVDDVGNFREVPLWNIQDVSLPNRQTFRGDSVHEDKLY